MSTQLSFMCRAGKSIDQGAELKKVEYLKPKGWGVSSEHAGTGTDNITSTNGGLDDLCYKKLPQTTIATTNPAGCSDLGTYVMRARCQARYN